MRVLVCGADGFIGSHVARCLRGSGHEVLGSVFGRPARAGEVRLDLLRDDLQARLPAQLDAVVNAVGEVKGQASAQQVFDANLHVTGRLARWAADRAVGHFVQLSSVAVYGPLVLGEGWSERTPRLGAWLGLPYMRSKAQAERLLEHSGLSLSLLRAPAVIGVGDTVLSTALSAQLRGAGLPIPRGGRLDHRVSLASAEGLAQIVGEVLRRGPVRGALHCGHLSTDLGALARGYAAALGLEARYRRLGFAEIPALKHDAGLSWWLASALFGQAYGTGELERYLPPGGLPGLTEAIGSGVSGLQG